MTKLIVKKEKPKEKTKTTREILWYDSFFKKLNKFEADYISYEYVEEEYVEDIEGNPISINDAIEKVIEHNKGMDKQKAYEILKTNCEIKKSYYLKGIPIKNKIKESSKIQDVKRIYEEYLNYNNADIDVYEGNDEYVFEANDRYMSDFCYALERKNVRFTLEK